MRGRVVGADVEEHRVPTFRVHVVLLERVLVFVERDDLGLVLVVVEAERVALPGLREENPLEVRVVLVLDAD